MLTDGGTPESLIYYKLKKTMSLQSHTNLYFIIDIDLNLYYLMHGLKFKISKILNFRNLNFQTCDAYKNG